jgi:hypothetical protein
MNYFGEKLRKNKILRLICLLLIFILFLYQGSKILYFDYVRSNQPEVSPFIQTSTPESETKQEIVHPIEISTVPFEQLVLFATNDYNFPIFEKDGSQYEIVYHDKKITHLQLSPDKRKIGFYIHVPQDEVILNKTSLVIMDTVKRNFNEISEGDLKVSNWAWKNNSQFIIYINCGTGCHLAHVRSLKDGKLIAVYLDRQDREY